ncbi:hypothetical protein BDA99DRAFT_513703 [Phascolomyces articulosus]|uniref:Pentacotripeptide-repeat region of PRORP domain-containing protein n=1 Tax=Phascolomyces articulosus TaxID=60185 RepID=A0AAD5K828_9FUNG|nr:hypothetical protein BDA99DRAFT_513703 [Phascolomyces articulosus]
MSSALARRGSKSAATACKHHHNRNYFSHSFYRRDVLSQHQNIRDMSMVWLLTAAACSTPTRMFACRSALGSTATTTQRRTFRAKSEQLASASRSMAMVDDSSSIVNDSPHTTTSATTRTPSLPKRFHPRRIGKGCDLDELFYHLDKSSQQLGRERIFKSLRAALYNASGYEVESAWRIFQQMIYHKVTDKMGANHYGHLLNILKYGTDQTTTVSRMLAILDHIRLQDPQKVSLTHYSQVLFAMGRMGDAKGACTLIHEMKREGYTPSSSHFTSLAIATRNDKQYDAIQESAEMMMEAMKKDEVILESDACVTMISLLSKHKTMTEDARIDSTVQFLETVEYARNNNNSNSGSMENKDDTPTTTTKSRYNVHMYTSLISGLAQKGDATNAKRLYDEMRQQGLKPTIATRTALIEAYGRAGDFDAALKLLNRKHKHHIAMVTSVLTNAIRHNKWDVADMLAGPWIERLENAKTDDKLRAALLWVKVKSDFDNARSFFDTLYHNDPSYVNTVMVNHLVTESGKLRSNEKVQESYNLHALTGNHPPSLYSQHVLVNALFKCRDVPAALTAFMNMRRYGVPDDITMAMVVRGLIMNDEDTVAWNVFRALKKGNLQPNLWAYTSMLKAFAKTQPTKGVSKELLGLWPELHAIMSGKDPSTVELVGQEEDKEEGVEKEIPRLTSVTKNPSQAYLLFSEMTGFQTPNEYTYTTLIACFSKHSLARATDVFSHMCASGVKPTVQTYTAMLQACSIFRSARSALLVFRHMQDQQVTPNSATWHYLLKALVRARVDKSKIDEIGHMAREAMKNNNNYKKSC